MWSYIIPDEKRICPIGGRNCYTASFDSYRQMLEHCRQKHPEKFSEEVRQTADLVVTDNHGRALSWNEVGQILEDPAFWREPLGRART